MAEANTGRFTLPDEPMDGYVIDAWRVDIDYGATGVHHLRFVYHVNRTWAELYPDLPHGASFENEWQVFDGDNFRGRRDGWKSPLEWLNVNVLVFATEREAQERAADCLRDRIDRHFEDVEAASQKLRRLEDALGRGRLYRQLKAEAFYSMLKDD